MLPLRVAPAIGERRARQFDDFVEPASKGCFATHLIGRLPAGFLRLAVATRGWRSRLAARQRVAFGSVRPTVRLVEPQVRVVAFPTRPTASTPRRAGAACPSRDYACVAVVDDAAVGDDAKPYVEVCWARELGARAQVPRAAQEAVLRVVRHSAETVAWTISSTLRGVSRRPQSPTCRRASSATSSSAASTPAAAVAARAPRSPAAVPLEAARAPRLSRGVPRRLLPKERLRLLCCVICRPPGRHEGYSRSTAASSSRAARASAATARSPSASRSTRPRRPASARRTTCRPLRNAAAPASGFSTAFSPSSPTTPTSCSRCRCAASSPTARGCARATASAATMESSPASAAPTSRSTSSAATTPLDASSGAAVHPASASSGSASCRRLRGRSSRACS